MRPRARMRSPRPAASTAPDVLLLDVRLGDGSGLEVNRWLAAHHPGIKVIMLTMSEDHDTALTALRDGASGYLVKGADPERLEHALRAAAGGDVVLDHDMAKAVTELALTRRRGASGRPFAGAHGARVRHPRARGPGPRQPGHRPATRPESEDGPQPRLERPHQAQRRRPFARHRAQPPARPRAGSRLRLPLDTRTPGSRRRAEASVWSTARTCFRQRSLANLGGPMWPRFE